MKKKGERERMGKEAEGGERTKGCGKEGASKRGKEGGEEAGRMDV